MKNRGVKKSNKNKNDSKSNPKKLRTFNSSEFSLLQDRHQASMIDLSIFKNENIIKRKNLNHSALSQYNSSKNNTLPKPAKKKKKTKVNGKQKNTSKQRRQQLQAEQQYQKFRYKQSNTNSQIVYSIDETKRESAMYEQKYRNYNSRLENMQKDIKYLRGLHTENDPNLVLRVNIKRQFAKKVQAATKIQKVFRGFMTRKILIKYITDSEERLDVLARTFREKSVRDSQQSQQKSTKNKDNQFYGIRKQNGEHLNSVFNAHLASDRTFKDDDRSENSSYLNENYSKYQYSHNVRPRIQLYQSQNDYKVQSSRSHKETQQNIEPKEQQQSQQQSQSQQSDSQFDQNQIIYRHKQVIYPHDDIRDLLQSSSQQQQDGYDPDIIFETNQQYLESRKSSMQNKNQVVNKLSKGHNNQYEMAMAVDNLDQGKLLKVHKSTEITENNEQIGKDDKTVSKINKIKNNNYVDEQEQQYEIKKIQDNKQKQDNKKYLNISVSSSSSSSIYNSKRHNKMNTIQLDAEQNQLQKHSEYSSDKFSDHNSTQTQREMIRLKQQQCQKWQEVIKMINGQIVKNQQNNGQMINFMKTIVELSQKNKQILGSTREINIQRDDTEVYTTPTSFSQPINYSHEKISKEKVKVNMKNECENNSDGKNDRIFKKKQLKIEIADSAFTAEEKQELFCQFQQFSNKKQGKTNKQARQKIQNVNKNNKYEKYDKYDKYEERNNQFYDSCPILQRKQDYQIQKKHKDTFNKSLMNSGKMKSFLSSNMHDETIQQILRLREEVLQKKQSEELVKLNIELNNKSLSQEQFIQKLSNLTKKFSAQKAAIDKSKIDIIKGYEAANSLLKEYFYDIKRMGFKIPISRSQDNLKYKASNIILNNIFVDEISPKSNPNSSISNKHREIFRADQIIDHRSIQRQSKFFNEEKKDSKQNSCDNSEVQFSEEELQRFRKAVNYDLDLNQLNGNMTITDDFIKRQQQAQVNIDSPLSIQRQHQPTRQLYLLDQKNLSQNSEAVPSEIDNLVSFQFEALIWQFASEIIVKPKLSEKIVDKSHLVRPQIISDQERMDFLELIQQNLPDASSLCRKLNQKITPLPTEILKCMRLDFSEEDNQDEDENYEQISKYEFVLSQEICAKSVMLFKDAFDAKAQQQKAVNQGIPSIQQVKYFCSFPDKLDKFIQQRQKFLKNRKQHTSDLRWQVINIEIHCLFDSWNEQIIQICSQRPGFSGIGLNQLTLALIDHNKPIKINNALPIIENAKDKLIQILTDQTELNTKILKQNFYEMAENDSAWIFYSDQALSYALQLVYLVQEQLYSEASKQIRRISLKSLLQPQII